MSIYNRSIPGSIFISFLYILTVCTLSAQTVNSVVNADHRPLAGAVDKLQDGLQVTINYEDAPYEHSGDLQDVSTPQQRAASPGFRLLVPVKGEVSTVVTGASDADKMVSILGLLNSHRNAGLPGDFTVEQANGAYYVIPIKVKAANGSMRDVSSVMRTPISLASGERQAIDAEAAIVNAIGKAAGVKIVIGSFPFRPVTKVTLAADREPARDVLARLFTKLSQTPVCYRLLYDPMMREYMLNVQAGQKPAVPVRPADPAIPTVQTPGPFFKKAN